MHKKILFLLILPLLIPFHSIGQDTDESPFSFGCDFVSRYIWRGMNLGGNTPSLQPLIGVDFGNDKHAFTFGTFGAWSFGGQQLQEADLFLTYTWNELLTLTVNDYFFPTDDGTGGDYFHYEAETTGHLFEGMIQFNGTEKFPVSLMFAMNFYGADAMKLNPDGTSNGIRMSKYAEIGYTREFSDMKWQIFAGAALDNPDEGLGEKGFYGNTSAGVINLGCKFSKEIQFSNGFALPVQAQLIFNPEAERVFMVFGLSL